MDLEFRVAQISYRAMKPPGTLTISGRRNEAEGIHMTETNANLDERMATVAWTS